MEERVNESGEDFDILFSNLGSCSSTYLQAWCVASKRISVILLSQ